MNNYLEVGGIFKSELFQNRSIRIFAFDEIEILYETGYGDSWKSDVLIYKEFNFYRISTGYFLAYKPSKIGMAKYTHDQKIILKLDLPISVGRSRKMSWSDLCNQAFEVDLKISTDTFNTEALYVYPFGPKGGVKSARKLVANNGVSFTTEELMNKCAIEQCKHYSDSEQGIGIFRSGMKSGLPTYYISGYHFGSETYKFHEENFDWSAHVARSKSYVVPVTIFSYKELGRYRIVLTSLELRKICSLLVVKSAATGKEVNRWRSDKEQFEIDLRGFVIGSYILEFGDGTEVFQSWMLSLYSAVDYPFVEEH